MNESHHTSTYECPPCQGEGLVISAWGDILRVRCTACGGTGEVLEDAWKRLTLERSIRILKDPRYD